MYRIDLKAIKSKLDKCDLDYFDTVKVKDTITKLFSKLGRFENKVVIGNSYLKRRGNNYKVSISIKYPFTYLYVLKVNM